jgi:hypothetical protein
MDPDLRQALLADAHVVRSIRICACGLSNIEETLTDL